MSRKVSIFETRSQRKDKALHCPFSSIDDCKPALHSFPVSGTQYVHSRASNEEALICLRAPERAVAFRSIYLLWACWCQFGCHSFPSPYSGHVYLPREVTELQRMQESQSPRLDPKARIGPYTVLSHPLKIANQLCILMLWNTICAFQSSQWRSMAMLCNCALRSAQAPMACYGHAGVNWAVIPFHL